MLTWNRAAVGFGLGLAACFLIAQSASAASSFVGFQTFATCTAGNNNSGICDTQPDSNSTFDASPYGSIGPDSTYIGAAIGTAASNTGRKGWGQQVMSSFLNGDSFGDATGNSDRLIENITLSNGDPGARIKPYATPNNNQGSSWKFGNSGNQRQGDIKLTNYSDYFFKLTFLNFDLRVGNGNSPKELGITYLATGNNLTRYDTGNPMVDGTSVYSSGVLGTGADNVSRGLGAATSTQVYLAPGDSAAFRFTWSNFGGAAAQSQLDNIAFQGIFYETAALTTEIDPATVVPEPTTATLLALGLAGLAMRRRS